MYILKEKFKEIIFSVLPIALLVLVLNFAITPIGTSLVIKFLIGALLIIIGLTVFLIGVDIGITPVGNIMGEKLTKKNKLWLIIIGGFLLGFFISIAEPDLHIIARQIEIFSLQSINRFLLIIIVSLGIGLSFAYGLYRIVNNISLKYTMTVLYFIILILAFFSPLDLLGITFDTSGATTGALTVPFVLAIAIGISRLNKNSNQAGNDSFGLVGIVSAGAIIAILIFNIFNASFESATKIAEATTYYSFLESIIPVIMEVSVALLPIIIIFMLFNNLAFKFNKKTTLQIYKGLFYTFLGMTLFLIGVNGGFLEVGAKIGNELAQINILGLLLICFLLGVTTILAEPAVYVLTKQIEDVTSGYIQRPFVLMALALGVGTSISLAMLRIQLGLDLWLLLLIGYFIAIMLTYFTPQLFIGMAFDAGAVASGPMTATFILAFMHGIANASGANILIDGFGMIALVALTPIITLQLLGLIYKMKSIKGGK